MSKAAKLDKMLERKRFQDDACYLDKQPNEQVINFNLNTDNVNGVFELDPDQSSCEE